MKRMLWLVCVGLAAASPLSAQEIKLRATLNGHTGAAYSVVFSPDGKILAVGTSDQRIELWDVKPENVQEIEISSTQMKEIMDEWERFWFLDPLDHTSP